MNYLESISYINSKKKLGRQKNLNRMKKLMDLLGNPQDDLKYIHVAGTNGKGSTVSFISNILKESGLKVGIYTSPYIQRFTERIKINDKEITKGEITNYLETIKMKIDIMRDIGLEDPVEFEIITAIAFLHYKKMNCDIVILEVGIGGIIDATNIIKDAEVSVITSIGYDHMKLLGNNLEEIAKNKAGIIKKNSNVVVYPQKKFHSIFKYICEEKNANIKEVNLKNLEIIEANLECQKFNYKNYNNLEICMLGLYQINNALVALETINFLIEKGYNILENNIKKGLFRTKWPGRFEILSKNPIFILDGAHNIQGVSALIESLKKLFNNKKIIFIVGFLKDKDYKCMIEETICISKMFLTVTPDETRGIEASYIANHIKKKYKKNAKEFSTVFDAVSFSLKISGKDDIICSFGSLYYIGKVRDYFNL